MRASQNEIARVLSDQGVLVRAQHPELAGAAAWARRQGLLASVLPGVYAPPARAGTLETRIQALALSDPDAVLIGATAARVSFWPSVRCPIVECSTRRQHAVRPGFSFRRSVIPPELIGERAGLRFSTPALAAVQLCDVVDGDGIDQALRTRTATLRGLWRAFELTPERPGNQRRRQVLLDSRDEPWSAAERQAHRLLRAAGLQGWKANHPVVLDGHLYYLDIAFPGARLAIEIDGRLHEDDPDVFENDRLRQNALVLAGWVVLRFTWRMLIEQPGAFAAAVSAALAQLAVG